MFQVLGVTARFVCPTRHGMFPHPSDCGRYFVCSSSVVFAMRCPAGLYFNPAIRVCDWKSNVVCRKEGFERASPPPSHDHDIQEDPESEINGDEFSPVITRPTQKTFFYFYKALTTTPTLVGGKELGEEEEGSGAV